jgi:hypothetical protein
VADQNRTQSIIILIQAGVEKNSISVPSKQDCRPPSLSEKKKEGKSVEEIRAA